MNTTFLSRMRERLSPKLNPNAETGPLTPQEKDTVATLFEILIADPTLPAASCLPYVDQKTTTVPGSLEAYREGLHSINQTANTHFSGADFCTLSAKQRNEVLHRCLRFYPHALHSPPRLRKLRLTPFHFDLVFSRSTTKRLRHFVIRDLLSFYYHRPEGWAVAGYDEYPGHVRHDREPCEVVKLIKDEDDRLLLELSDATIEELDPAGLLADTDFMLTVTVKGGRQRASFARAAYYQLVEYVDTEDERFVFRLADTMFDIPCIGDCTDD